MAISRDGERVADTSFVSVRDCVSVMFVEADSESVLVVEGVFVDVGSFDPVRLSVPVTLSVAKFETVIEP